MMRIGKIIEDNINNLQSNQKACFFGDPAGNQLPAALKEIVKL